MLFDRIRKLSEQRGENLKTVSRKLGLSENAIYKWKTQSPNIENVKKVAEYFNVSLDYLTGFNEELGEWEKQRRFEDLCNDFNEYDFEVEYSGDVGMETVYINHSEHGTIEKMNFYDFIERGESILANLKRKYNVEEVETIAAHHDGGDWTEEELKTIEEFKKFVRSQRKNKG